MSFNTTPVTPPCPPTELAIRNEAVTAKQASKENRAKRVAQQSLEEISEDNGLARNDKKNASASAACSKAPYRPSLLNVTNNNEISHGVSSAAPQSNQVNEPPLQALPPSIVWRSQGPTVAELSPRSALKNSLKASQEKEKQKLTHSDTPLDMNPDLLLRIMDMIQIEINDDAKQKDLSLSESDASLNSSFHPAWNGFIRITQHNNEETVSTFNNEGKKVRETKRPMSHTHSSLVNWVNHDDRTGLNEEDVVALVKAALKKSKTLKQLYKSNQSIFIEKGAHQLKKQGKLETMHIRVAFNSENKSFHIVHYREAAHNPWNFVCVSYFAESSLQLSCVDQRLTGRKK
jgi:hypothetical protein